MSDVIGEAKVLRGPYSKGGRSLVIPAVSYVYETLSITRGEERRLEVFEKGVLRGIFQLIKTKTSLKTY
jgi:hypothetical protein